MEKLVSRRSLFPLLALPALAVGAAVALGPTGQAFAPPKVTDHRTRPGTENIKDIIKRNGKVPSANYWQHVEALHKAQRRTVAAAPFLKAKTGTKSAMAAAGGGSTTTTVGDAPPGFGKGFTWDRKDNEILLVMFINAADPFGVSIDGVQAGDQVQVMTASGIASYSSDKGNPTASSIIGLVAAGANVLLSAEGAPEVAPVIDAAQKFAQDQFKATNAKTKRRDAFGVDPSSGLKAREEGGLLVCLPEAGGTYYSGDGDHKNRWIQGNGVRTDDHLPAHIFGAFFPIQGDPGQNTRIMQQSGQMYIIPWDWQFDDNAGFYKVFVKLTKGNGPPPPPPIPRTNPQAKPQAKKPPIQ
jgi:hypothetical protein